MRLATLRDQLREMGRARCDAGFGLDEIDDIESKAAREIRPRIVIGNELHAREGRQSVAPSLAPHLELGKEAIAIGDDALTLLGRQADEGFGDASSDDDGVFGVEPVMRIGDSVRVAAFVHNALPANFEQRNSGRCVEVGVAPANETLVANRLRQRVQPVVVAKPDPHQQRRAPHLFGVSRTRLERLRIGGGRHNGFHAYELAAHCRRKRGQVGGGRDHTQRG